GIVSATSIKNDVAEGVNSAPDDHFAAGPHCRVRVSARGCIGRAGGCPTIGAGIVSPAGVAAIQSPAVEDGKSVELGAGSHRRVRIFGSGGGGGAGGCPTLVAGIVSPPGVRKAGGQISAPDDHFAAAPHCRVLVSGRWCVGGAGGCPTIGAGIVSPTGVAAIQSPPDDHFTAGPHCRVKVSCSGCIAGAGSCPRAVDAAARGASYYRKRVSRIRWIGRSADDGGKSRRPRILDRFAIGLVIERRSARST